MSRGHFCRGARPGIGKRHGVVAGFLEQSRNQGSDLAGAQYQYPMHGDSSFRMWQSA